MPSNLEKVLREQIQKGPGPWRRDTPATVRWGRNTPTAAASLTPGEAPALGILCSMLELSQSRPVQAATILQAAGLKGMAGDRPISISLSTSLRLPPEISHIVYACRYPEACAFVMQQERPSLVFPNGPTMEHLLIGPLRSRAGRWLETCRWVSVPERPEDRARIGQASLTVRDRVLSQCETLKGARLVGSKLFSVLWRCAEPACWS